MWEINAWFFLFCAMLLLFVWWSDIARIFYKSRFEDDANMTIMRLKLSAESLENQARVLSGEDGAIGKCHAVEASKVMRLVAQLLRELCEV